MLVVRAGGVVMLDGVRVLEANRSQLSWDLVDLELCWRRTIVPGWYGGLSRRWN